MLARRHVSGARATVILHDANGGGAFEVGAKGWALVAAMDGTRDALGLSLAIDGRASVEEVERFLAELEGVGALEEGRPRDEPEAEARAQRPVEVLEGYALRCDGRGVCCAIYPSIVFTSEEAARARATMPEVLGGGEDEARVFLPERGADRRSLAVAVVDGRCAYLGEDRRCGLHARGGAGAKPLGCRAYPTALVDDGEAIRVGPVVECACVIASAVEPGPRGAPLLEGSPRTSAELDPRLVVDELPETIALHGSMTATRREVREWADAARAVAPDDVAARFAELAAQVRAHGLATKTKAARFDVESLLTRVDALGEAAARRQDERFRSERDAARRAFAWISTACALARRSPALFAEASPDMQGEERFYFRAVLFGHQAVPRSAEVTLAEELTRRAVRVVVARAMKAVARLAGLEDPGFRYPLAVLEAMVRAYGLPQ
jgi:lysine-N-methylase